MSTLWQDIHYGFRMLRKTPGFAVVVVLILEVGDQIVLSDMSQWDAHDRIRLK